MELLIFGLGSNEQFGVDVLSVREIMPIGTLNRLPGSSSKVSGCMNVRGQSVPVMNLSKALFDASDAHAPTMAIILDRQEHFALAVSSVDRIMKISDEQMSDIQKVSAGGLIEGVINDQNGLIQLLNAEKIIAMAIA